MTTEITEEKGAIISELERRLLLTYDIHNYIFAGKATFTLRSIASGTRFTYKIKETDQSAAKQKAYKKEVNEKKITLFRPQRNFFVALLSGPNNSNDFTYMGMISQTFGQNTQSLIFYHTQATHKNFNVREPAPSMVAITWFIKALNNLDAEQLDKVEVWHSGRCGRCGKKLTVPASIALGLGPECASK